MVCLMWLTEEAAARLAVAASEKAPVQSTYIDDQASNWRRHFFWIDHMIEGKQHIKEADVIDAVAALGLRGQLFFGAPR